MLACRSRLLPSSFRRERRNVLCPAPLRARTNSEWLIGPLMAAVPPSSRAERFAEATSGSSSPSISGRQHLPLLNRNRDHRGSIILRYRPEGEFGRSFEHRRIATVNPLHPQLLRLQSRCFLSSFSLPSLISRCACVGRKPAHPRRHVSNRITAGRAPRDQIGNEKKEYEVSLHRLLALRLHRATQRPSRRSTSAKRFAASSR